MEKRSTNVAGPVFASSLAYIHNLNRKSAIFHVLNICFKSANSLLLLKNRLQLQFVAVNVF